MAEIEILHERIATNDLRRLVLDGFGDMVKYVAGWCPETHAAAFRALPRFTLAASPLWKRAP
jgi:hypothetical protein